jgi:hypothetical protein
VRYPSRPLGGRRGESGAASDSFDPQEVGLGNAQSLMGFLHGAAFLPLPTPTRMSATPLWVRSSARTSTPPRSSRSFPPSTTAIPLFRSHKLKARTQRPRDRHTNPPKVQPGFLMAANGSVHNSQGVACVTQADLLGVVEANQAPRPTHSTPKRSAWVTHNRLRDSFMERPSSPCTSPCRPRPECPQRRLGFDRRPGQAPRRHHRDLSHHRPLLSHSSGHTN